MDFFQLFKLLVDATQSSLADIARSIAYDRSYVSKWYNGKALPAQDSWAEISDRLADYFAHKMTPEDFDRLAQANALVKSSYTTHGAFVTLKSFLDDAYKVLRTQGAADLIFPEGLSVMLEGASEAIHMIYQLIESDASMLAVEKHAYFTGDILDAMNPEIVDALRFPYTSPAVYVFHFMTDAADLSPSSQASIQKVHHYFRLVSQMPFIRFVPYVTSPLGAFQICMEDTLCAYGTSAPSLDQDFRLFLTMDPQSVADVQANLLGLFQDLAPAVRQEGNLEGMIEDLRQVPRSEKPLLYMSSPPLYWAGDDLRQSLYEAGSISDLDNDIWKGLSRMTQMAEGKAIFILPEEGLNLVLDQGLVKTYKGYLQLEGRDKETYIRDTLASMEEKIQGSEWIMIPKTTPGYDRLPQCTIYADGDFAFYALADFPTEYETKVAFYTFPDRALSQTVYHYLQKLANLEKGDFVL